MKLSIVIPTYNGKELLEKYLPAVKSALADWLTKSGEKGEIIVADDCSTDTTVEWLKKTYPEIRILVNSRNYRFGETCNRGVRASKGEAVVLLNNDVKPEKGFLLPLLERFENEKVFAVGCREINFEKGKKLTGGKGVSQFRRGLVIHWRPVLDDNSKITWVSAGSAAYRKSMWLKLGGFDRLFRPAYEEDRDIAYRALKSGYQLTYEPRSVVKHYHETTNFSEFGQRRIAVYSMKNQLLFIWKNISSIRMIVTHCVWLPYHLTLTTWRTRGKFLLAFLMALKQFPEAVSSRVESAKNWKRRDEEILGLG